MRNFRALLELNAEAHEQVMMNGLTDGGTMMSANERERLGLWQRTRIDGAIADALWITKTKAWRILFVKR